MNKKKLLAGITKDNELYFLEINPTNDKRNGYDEFSMSGFTVRPIELEEAKEQSYANLKSIVEEETENISGLYLRDIDEIVQEIIDSDGNLHGLDTSLFEEDVEVDGETYVFESGSCGQHKEKELKHYFIPKETFDASMDIWEQYHLKETPTGEPVATSLRNILKIEQDIPELVKQAIEIINKDNE